jgi:hypothetical protein
LKKYLVCLSLLTAFAVSAPAFADTLYSDGPVDGNTNAFFIDGPVSGPYMQTISDGFVASLSGNVAVLDFAEWVPTGSTPTSVSWMLGTSAFGSDISSGSTSLVTSTFLFSSSIAGYDIYSDEVTGLSGSLVAGQTYYLTLGGANDSLGSQFDGWDVDEGPATCSFAVDGVNQGDCGDGGETFSLSTSSTPPPSTPEPSSLLLLGSGILGMAGVVRRKLNR